MDKKRVQAGKEGLETFVYNCVQLACCACVRDWSESPQRALVGRCSESVLGVDTKANRGLEAESPTRRGTPKRIFYGVFSKTYNTGREGAASFSQAATCISSKYNASGRWLGIKANSVMVACERISLGYCQNAL